MTATTITLGVIPENIPDELQARDQWVVWRWEKRNEKWTKPLYNARTGKPAKSADGDDSETPARETWSSFGEALAAYQLNGWDGIGYVTTADDPITGIDIDKCRDPETGEIADWAEAIVASFDSYTEITPSGRGLRLYVHGSKPGPRCKAHIESGAVEMYDKDRFFTITGHIFGDALPIGERQHEIDGLYHRLFPSGQSTQTPSAVTPTMDDLDIIERARKARNGPKFERLFYAGDTSEHDFDDNKADLGLLSIITFWTQDEIQIDRIFRQSALNRPKWESRADYRRRSIEKALNRRDVFTPQGTTPPPAGMNGGRKHDDIPPVDPPSDSESETTSSPARFPLTDTGNAERLVCRYGNDVRFNWGRGVWHVWSGKHWQEDKSGRMEQLAKATVRAIPAEAAGLEGDAYTKVLKWAASSESHDKRQSLVKLARAEDGVPVQPHQLDSDPWLLNVGNGTLDLRTGELRNHRRDDLITRLIDVPYKRDAACPLFLAFLNRIFDGDDKLVAYVQRLIGYSLTGSIREQILIIAYGTGSNGKSTLLGIMRRLLGDYAREADADSFMEKRNEAIREDIADLDAARFVAASETADGKRLSEALVKKMTGGERLRARRLYENGYEFQPQFKVWLSTNHRPVIHGTEYAIWRRIRLVPFTVTIGEDEKDPDLPEKLAAELPGILAWAVRGCMEWQRIGLSDPPAVTQATDDYQRDMDILADWIKDRCTLDRRARELVNDLYADYEEYCEANGDDPIKKRTFGDRLIERGLKRDRTGKGRYIVGIRLNGDGTEPQQVTFDDTAESDECVASDAFSGNSYTENDLEEVPETNDTYDTYDTTADEEDWSPF